MKFRTVTAIILVATLLLGVVSCKRDKPRETNYIIGEDDPWYLATEFYPEEMMGSDRYLSDVEPFIQSLGESFLTVVSDVDYSDQDYSTSYKLCFGLFRMSGMMICSNELEWATDYYELTVLGGYYNDDGELEIMFSSSPDYSDDSLALLYKVRWDTKANELSSPEVIDLGDVKLWNVMSCDRYDNYTVVEGFYYDDSEDVSHYPFIFLYKDQYIDTIDLVGTGYEGFTLNSFSVEDGKLYMDGFENMIVSGDYSGECLRITYDTAAGNVDFGKAMYNTSDSVIGFDGREYVAHSDGIYTGDELYLSYLDCNIRPTRYRSFDVMSVEEDRIVISGYELDYDSFSYRVKIVKFEKMPDNPNAGKRVINAICIDELTPELVEGILNFNYENQDYYIRCQVRELFSYGETIYNSNLSQAYDSIKQNIDTIRSELDSDTGPDIVFNADKILGLTYSDHFIDLSRELELDENKFFTNVIDAAKIDGKLYSLPLSFYINALMIEQPILDEGQTVITFDQYKEMVEAEFHGTDPLYSSYTRSAYLANLIPYNTDIRTLDMDTEGFRKLVEYIRDNVRLNEDKNYYMLSGYYDMLPNINTMSIPAQFFWGYNSSSLFGQSTNYEEPVLCALPSYNGKELCAELCSSVSVCSKTGVRKGCIEFLEELLTPRSLLNSENMTISKETESARASFKYRNSLTANLNHASIYNETVAQDISMYVPSDEDKEKVFSVIDRVDSVYSLNYLLLSVVEDETNKVFTGEKDLDSAIESINERLQYFFEKEDGNEG